MLSQPLRHIPWPGPALLGPLWHPQPLPRARTGTSPAAAVGTLSQAPHLHDRAPALRGWLRPAPPAPQQCPA